MIPGLQPPVPQDLPPLPPAMENEDGSYTVDNQVFAADKIEVNSDGTVTIEGNVYRTVDFVASSADEPSLAEPHSAESHGLTTEAGTNPWFNANLIAELFTLLLEYTAATSRDRLGFADIMADMFAYMMTNAEDVADTIIEMGELRAMQKWLEVAQAAVSVGANVGGLRASRGASEATVMRIQMGTKAFESAGAMPLKGLEAVIVEPGLALLEAQKVILEELLKINDQTMSTISEAMSSNADIIQQFLQALLRWVEQQLHAHSLRAG